MSDSKQIKAIKGMHDLLPTDSAIWQQIEKCCTSVLQQRGYREIRTPILESTHVFARSIGAETDIVAKEMYSFDDRNGDNLSLRPEGTASVVRAGIEHGLFYNQQQRLWYSGPMFRHERPQKGRYRQFYQIGAECFGWATPDIEAEVIGLTAQLFERLGLQNTELQINSLGDTETRQRYRTALVDYLQQHHDALDDDSQRRLDINPLRILDSKNPATQQILQGAPSILDYLSEQSQSGFSLLQGYLQALNINFTINPRLVRGLDYYNDTVFEWVNADFGAQATVCAGGRYDGLVARLGGADTPAFGFAMGMERLVQMLQEQDASSVKVSELLDVYLISIGEPARQQALALQHVLTKQDLRVCLHCGAASMKNQFKHADKSNAKIALIIGEDEAAAETVSIKALQDRSQSQQTIPQTEALNAVTNLLESL